MAPVLLFITGVLTGVIAGFILSRLFMRGKTGDDAGERKLLEERLLKADKGLEQFSYQLEAQNAELKAVQQAVQEAREAAAISRTQLNGISEERDELKAGNSTALIAIDQLRTEKEKLSEQMAEMAEKLRSQESQTQFLEQARADLLTQFRSLSGQMLDGSRDALLKSTKETVSEPFARQMEQLQQQMQLLQKESVEKLGMLAQTTMDLRQRSEDVQGAAQQLTSALRSPKVKGR